MENKLNVYTINDSAPPSYAEATRLSALRTQDHLYQGQSPQFEQRYPHSIVCPSPSASFPYPNCYMNRIPVQLTYPEQQSQSVNVSHERTLIVGPREDNTCKTGCRLLWITFILVSTIAAIFTILYRLSIPILLSE